MRKVIIYGYKLYTHTHSYVHYGFYKAFKHLGFDVHWVSETDQIGLEFYKNSLIILSKNKPVPYDQQDGFPSSLFHDSSLYWAHGIDPILFAKFGVNRDRVVNFQNYTLDSESFEKIGPLNYWDQQTRTLYQAWGTHRLSSEIASEVPSFTTPDMKNVNFIGTLYENHKYLISEFAKIAKSRAGIDTRICQKVPLEDQRSLIKSSFLCPDFRSDWHLQVGYIPQRIMENISFGRVPGTNSPLVKRALSDFVIFGGCMDTLFENLLLSDSKAKFDLAGAMDYVARNFTFEKKISLLLSLG